MRTAGRSRTDIRDALRRLGELAAGAGRGDAAARDDQEELDGLRDRLDSARLRVLVVGEAKRGKSTLVNALLGRSVLPSGVVPLTAVPATVRYAPPEEEGTEVGFADGRSERFPLSAVADFGTERGNPGNDRGVRSITVWVDAPVLARGVELVDTPGTGSVHEHNTRAADAALPSMDAAIFVLTADPPVSGSERDLLRRVAGLSVASFVVLNKADYLDQASLEEALDFTAAVVAEVTGRPERVYPVSARAALSPEGDPGFAAFAADLDAYLGAGRAQALEQAVTRHARRIARQMLDETVLAQRAARLPGEGAEAEVSAFRARLEAVAGRRVRAEDYAAAQSGRLLEALNAAAAQARPQLARSVAGDLAALLDGELAAVPAAELEWQGRARLTRIVADAAEGWRQQQARAAEQGLRGIDDTLSAELEADLAAVRAAAADLLGLDLALASPGDRLPPDLGFFYDLSENVDQTELLAGALRRRMPGGLGRRLARQQLLGQVDELIDSQVGRARGDLQYRLAEATRRLLADLRRRYSAATQRLEAALDRADAIRSSAGEQAQAQLADLCAREQSLRDLLASLPAVST